MVVIMEESVDYSEITQENLTIRERGNLSAQEYLRVVETFNKVLEYKEKFRNSLEAKLSAISKEVNDNLENLETLLRNVDIYDQNIDKISSNVGNLYSEENAIKAQYEELLNGSAMEAPKPEEKNHEDQEGSREILIQRRRNYLDNLDKSFKRMDSELLSIEKLRAELTNARGEILVKKDGAKKKVRLLEEAGKKLKERREEFRLSRNELAKLTRITPNIIEAVEEGWVNKFPESAYLRAMLGQLEAQLEAHKAEQKAQEEMSIRQPCSRSV